MLENEEIKKWLKFDSANGGQVSTFDKFNKKELYWLENEWTLDWGK